MERAEIKNELFTFLESSPTGQKHCLLVGNTGKGNFASYESFRDKNRHPEVETYSVEMEILIPLKHF